MEDRELLQYALEHGMIDVSYVQEQIEMNKREELLKKHPYKIWEGKDGKWYTYLPNGEKGRALKKRNSKKAIEDVVVSYYEKEEGEQRRADKEEEQKKQYAVEDLTLRKVFPEWLKYKSARTNSTSYIKRITADWHRFYERNEIADKRIVDYDKIYLDGWVHTIIKSNKLTKKAYYDMSIILRQSLDYLVDKGLIEKNIFREVNINTKLFLRKKKPESESQVYLKNETPKIINDMLRRFRNNPKNTAPLAVIFCFETGVRIGELVCINKTDIQGDYVRIQRQEVRDFEFSDEYTMRFSGFKVVEYVKSDDGYRDIFLTNTAKQIIDIIEKTNEKYGYYDHGYLFLENGKRINHYAVQAMILRGCEAVNIPTKTMHKVRKTFISALIDADININEVRRVAGHSDERTTLGNYCFNRETNPEIEKKLEGALNVVDLEHKF